MVRSIDKAKTLLPEVSEFVQGDITDRVVVRHAMEGCTVVYHSAGLHEQWLSNPLMFDQVNVAGTENVLEAALAHGIQRLIYTSTIDVLAGQSGQEFDESRLDPQPRGTYYERSKQKAEQKAVAGLQSGLPIIFLHPSVVYGPGPASSPGFNEAIKQVLQGQMPALPPGGCAVVFAPDVGEGHVLAEERAATGSRYILSETYCTLKELAEITLAEAGIQKSPPPTIPLPIASAFSWIGERVSHFTGRPPLIPKGALYFMQWQARPRSDKAQLELNWKPTPLREGLRKTIAFLNRQSSDSGAFTQ